MSADRKGHSHVRFARKAVPLLDSPRPPGQLEAALAGDIESFWLEAEGATAPETLRQKDRASI